MTVLAFSQNNKRQKLNKCYMSANAGISLGRSLFILLLMSSRIVWAEAAQISLQDDADNAALKSGQPEKESSTWLWLVEKRDAFSQGFSKTTEAIDRFFSGIEAVDSFENESYLRLTLGGTQFKAGRFVGHNKLKLKLDLPGTEHRWKLIFSSEDEQDSSVAEQATGVLENERLIGDKNTTGAFRYMLSEYKRWKFDADLGLKTPFPIDPFIRLRARRSIAMNDNWRADFGQKLYYYHRRQFILDTYLYFAKPLSKQYVLRHNLRARFTDRINTWEMSETVMLTHYLNSRYTLNYSAGAIALSQPGPRLTTVFAYINIRQRLYKDWMFISFQPGLNFYREDDYKLSPSFGLRLELLLSN